MLLLKSWKFMNKNGICFKKLKSEEYRSRKISGKEESLRKRTMNKRRTRFLYLNLKISGKKLSKGLLGRRIRFWGPSWDRDFRIPFWGNLEMTRGVSYLFLRYFATFSPSLSLTITHVFTSSCYFKISHSWSFFLLCRHFRAFLRFVLFRQVVQFLEFFPFPGMTKWYRRWVKVSASKEMLRWGFHISHFRWELRISGF